jgi:hypothetical protein
VVSSPSYRVSFVGCDSEHVLPTWVRRGICRMHIPDEVRKSVVFLGAMQNGRFVPKATGFLVLTYLHRPDTPPQLDRCPVAFPFLVTAEHVVSHMQLDGLDIYCRMNLKNGSVAIEPIDKTKWLFHPPDSQLTDVAAAPFWINTDIVDHLYIPFHFPRDERLRQPPLSSVSLGAEVFAVGLFSTHYGRERNIPIIRVGNVAAMPEEPVHTKYAGDIEAYLIELRSIAGLSGSPVFIDTQYERAVHLGNNTIFQDYIFMGLIHGHFDIQESHYDSVIGDELHARGGINTGIGVVVPSRLIFETIHQPESVARMVAQAKLYLENGAAPDIGVIERRRNGFGIFVD